VLGCAWAYAVQSRGLWIHPYCPAQPERCSPQSLFFFDRWGYGNEIPLADALSFLGQNISGILAILVPLAWGIRARIGLRNCVTDFVLLFEATALNGVMNECVHAITHRPRPFVYFDPLHRGTDPAHYTSFYSGHTSFAATAGACLVISLITRNAPSWMRVSGLSLVSLLTVGTGVCRILAGRHFPSDVVGGIAAGVFAALVIAQVHRTRS